MNENTLKAWRDIEPSAHFEDHVWQRIQAAQKQSFLWNPLWASAIAAMLGILLGISAEFYFFNKPANTDLLALNRTGTLTGDYVNLLKGTIP